MKRRLLYFWIVVAIVCIVSVTNESVRAQGMPIKGAQHEVNVEACNRCDRGCDETKRHPTGNACIESSQSQRIGSSRNPRLSSNNGGSSGKELYLPKTHDKYNLLNFASLLLCYDSSRSHLEAESPRLYYVIALRRIIC